MNVENHYQKFSFPHGKARNFSSMNYNFSGEVQPGSKKIQFLMRRFYRGELE